MIEGAGRGVRIRGRNAGLDGTAGGPTEDAVTTGTATSAIITTTAPRKSNRTP